MNGLRSERIAVVTTSYPRDDGDPSGHFVRSQASALARGGASVHVLAPRGVWGEAACEEGSLVVHGVGGAVLFGFPGAIARAKERPLRLAGAAVFASGVRRRLRELGPFDRVVAHWMVPCAWPLVVGPLASGAVREARLEVVAHGADVRLLVAAPAAVRVAIVGALLGRGARFQMVATHLLDALAGSLPAALGERLRAASRVEPAPIDVPDASDVAVVAARLRASLAMREGERLAVGVGRLVSSKRFELAIEASSSLAIEASSSLASASSFASAPSAVRLVIVGDGPDRPRLEALARSTGGRVSFVGAVPRGEALAWIAAADVLVHPSAEEGAPSVVREARALGVRVIACAAGDVERWARLDAGIAIVPPSAAALADALRFSPMR